MNTNTRQNSTGPDGSMMNTSKELIQLLTQQLQDRQPQGWSRFEQALHELHADFSNRRFFHLFAICPRWFEQQLNAVEADGHSEWDRHDRYGVLRSWQYPQLARLLVLLHV